MFAALFLSFIPVGFFVGPTRFLRALLGPKGIFRTFKKSIFINELRVFLVPALKRTVVCAAGAVTCSHSTSLVVVRTKSSGSDETWEKAVFEPR